MGTVITLFLLFVSSKGGLSCGRDGAIRTLYLLEASFYPTLIPVRLSVVAFLLRLFKDCLECYSIVSLEFGLHCPAPRIILCLPRKPWWFLLIAVCEGNRSVPVLRGQWLHVLQLLQLPNLGLKVVRASF
jgi:hypothetical protein